MAKTKSAAAGFAVLAFCVLLRHRWLISQFSCVKIRYFGINNWVENVNWPPKRVKRLKFRALALRQSDWRRANARNVSLFTLYGGQVTFSTQLLTPVLPSQRRSTTVSLETYTPYLKTTLFLVCLSLDRTYTSTNVDKYEGEWNGLQIKVLILILKIRYKSCAWTSSV